MKIYKWRKWRDRYYVVYETNTEGTYESVLIQHIPTCKLAIQIVATLTTECNITYQVGEKEVTDNVY